MGMFEFRTTDSLKGVFFACLFVCFSQDNQQVDAIHVTQLERDTVLVCLDREYLLSRFQHLCFCCISYVFFHPLPLQKI